MTRAGSSSSRRTPAEKYAAHGSERPVRQPIIAEQVASLQESTEVPQPDLEVNRAAVEAALQNYQDLFNLAPDPYLTTDAAGVIHEANAAAVGMLKLPLEKMSGTPVSRFIPSNRRRAFRVALARIATGEEPVPESDEWIVQVKPFRGDPLEVSVATTSVRGRTGTVRMVRWLLRDVTARRRAEAEVRALNADLEQRVHERTAALEAANWAKAEFLSVMAHELRTPLNAIIGYAELLEMGIPGPVGDAQLAHLNRIRASGQRVIALVNEVLDLGKVEAGQLRVVREECEISVAIAASVSLIRPQAASRGISIKAECGGPDASIKYIGDQSRVEQILINLLANGIKFTESGGEVRISCSVDVRAEVEVRSFEARHRWLAVRVSDNGIGMPSEMLSRVFDPFVQVEKPLTRTRGGTGLGLTISRRLARLMGGDLTVASKPGEGSTFTLWLPAAEELTSKSAPVERRSSARYTQGIADLGTGLLEQIDAIIRSYAKRLRARTGIPKAAKLSKSELEDHAAAFLADIVQALVAIEEAEGGPSDLMRDGSVLRRIISERHGAQRQRLGWTEEDLRLEFSLLRRSIDTAVRRVQGRSKDAEAVEARKAAQTLLARLLDTAEDISVRGFRLAAMDELQNPRAIR